ncbi:hypothetical protein LguiA_026354 [Lonicera macranthoides]
MRTPFTDKRVLEAVGIVVVVRVTLHNASIHAIACVEGDKYYGAKATINVWEPKIQQPKEFSLSHFWVLGGSFGEDLNSIQAGWQRNSTISWRKA